MKKIYLTLCVAALALVSCVKTNDVYTGTPESRQIAFSPFALNATKAPIDGTTFSPESMQVAAYDVTNSRDFFAATAFTKDNVSGTWKGGKYWPLSAARINFLAYAELNNTEGSSATWDVVEGETSEKASGVVLVMADNKTAQSDLMYAIGTGAVTQDGNSLLFPDNVPMVFKHAQAWISFYVDAYDATSGGKVTLNSITLNGAKYNGTFTVTHANYNAASEQAVSGAWGSLGSTADVAVPGWTPAAVAYDEEGDGVVVGNGLLIVPDDDSETADFSSFTIAYTLDGNNYTYTYTPDARNVDQAKHYIYNINFHLHEIEIAASVTDWVDQSPVAVPIF